MEISVNKNGAKLVIAPVGRIDSVTSGEVEEAIKGGMSDDVTELCIDMSKVDFVSSKGIRIFLAMHRDMASKGRFVLSNINNSVREVLKLSALLDVFNIE